MSAGFSLGCATFRSPRACGKATLTMKRGKSVDFTGSAGLAVILRICKPSVFQP
jgi:hypothetical protein